MTKKRKYIEINTALKSAGVKGPFWTVVLEAYATQSLLIAALAMLDEEWFKVDLEPEPDSDGRKGERLTIHAQLAGPSVDHDGLWSIPLLVPVAQSHHVAALSMMTHVVFKTRFTPDDKAHTR